MLLGLWLLGAAGMAQAPERSLLVVASEQSGLETIAHAELRKIFLGVPVTQNEVRIRPLLNATDPLATRIFLQQVVFMSEREYKRQLLSRVFRLGDQRPKEYDDIEELVAGLNALPGALTFMWSDELADHPTLKPLGVLWASSTD